MMLRRRRPLMRAAMVGGAGYMAGKSVARGSARESDEQQRIAQLEAQQQPLQQAPVAAPPAAGSDLISQLRELQMLQQEGVLTADEFETAKQKLLAS
jgi:Short C-terminal domain